MRDETKRSLIKKTGLDGVVVVEACYWLEYPVDMCNSSCHEQSKNPKPKHHEIQKL